jgi:apolipoprotein N-acyltransferase
VSIAATGTRPPWATGRHLAQQAARPADPGPLAPRLLAALGSGLLATLAFPPYDAWPLAVPAVAVLVLVCRNQRPRRAALLGLAHGVALFLPLLAWMQIIGADAWVALALLEAACYAAMGALLALVTRLPAWPLWAASLWVAQELARATAPFGGFPWGRLAFGQTDSPFLPYAALGGAALVTFATALTGALLAAAAVALRQRALPAGALVAALAVPVAALLVPLPTDGPATTAAVVQGNVPRPGLHFLGEREQVLRNHVTATERLAAAVRAGRVARPDLVIWPENASDIDPFANADAYALIDGAVRAVGVPVLVGAVLDGPGPDHVSNAGIVWSPQSGPGARYVKRHPVPFGEYIPFRAQLTRVIKRLDQIPRDFHAGSRPGLLQVGPARVLVVQTNNATYNRTGQPAQQLAMSRLRAVEHGRTVLVAATSGISAIVTPEGRVQARTGELTARTLVRAVPLRTGRTVADRLGGTLEWLLAAAGLTAALAGGLAGRRRNGRP